MISLKSVQIADYAACIFDFDGVVIDGFEEAIFQLDEEEGERENLAQIARHLGIKCDQMDVRYQRHLLYQAAAQKIGLGMSEGPAFELFAQASEKRPCFLLSARSGWFAVERARAFMAETGNIPVETFFVGRVSKTLQIETVMAEHHGNIIFFDDRLEHIEKVNREIDNTIKNRLDLCHIKKTSRYTRDARIHFNETVEAVISS